MPPPIIVAIDFGTTRSAWAYHVKGQAGEEITVRIPDAASDSGSSRVKTETAVLMEGGVNGDLIKYGVAAHDEFLRLYENEEAEGEEFFRWFKLALCGKGRFTSIDQPKVRSHRGNEVPLINVIKAALGYFKKDALEVLSGTVGERVFESDVNWVLTVPAIYDQFAKSFMRHAAHEAGMIESVNSNKLRLCLEPEAACIAITSEGGNHPLTVESEGKQIMILDCGGGTVDITMHKVVGVEPLKLMETAAPTGGTMGSTDVDRDFEKWLGRFFGEMFDQIKGTTAFLSITMAWERKKAEFQGTETGHVQLRLSELANHGIDSRDLEELCKDYNEAQGSSDKVVQRGFNIDLPASLVKSFFAPTINKIIACLRDIKQLRDLDNLHRVFLVGGFSRCRMLQQNIRELFDSSGCSVVAAHEPDLLIVKGAVTFFNSSGVFTSRKARFTYGVRCGLEYERTDPEHRRRHAANGTYRESDGKIYVDNCFQRHITIGQDIPVNSTFQRQDYLQGKKEKDPSKVTITIFASEKENPSFIDEEGCFKIGEGRVKIDADAPVNRRGVSVQFTYGGTELLVDFFHLQTDKRLEGGLCLLPNSP